MATKKAIVQKPIFDGLSHEERTFIENLMSSTAIEHLPVQAIKPNSRNPKDHPYRQIWLIAENMRRVSVTHPLLIDENNDLLAGHARLAAFKLLKLIKVLQPDDRQTQDGFIEFLTSMFERVNDYVEDGSVVYCCMDWRHYPELVISARRIFTRQPNLIVWAKTTAGQGSFYRSQHELIGVFVAGTAAPLSNFKLGAHGRHRTNVWRYPTVRSCHDSLLALQPR